MGNVARIMGDRAEEAIIPKMRELLDKYDSIKSHAIEVGEPLSDRQLYLELKQELVQLLEISGLSVRRSCEHDQRDAVESGRMSRVEPTPSLNPPLDPGHGQSLSNIRVRSRSPGAQPDGHKTSILVVDDSRISCKLATHVLGRGNFYCEVALSGEKALEILNSKPEAFNLVLLDIVMPDVDGIEVLKRMNRHPQLKKIPVAVLSGLESRTLEETCLGHGAVVVLVKPLRSEDILRVVDKYCGALQRHPGSLAVPFPSPVPSPPACAVENATRQAPPPGRTKSTSPLARTNSGSPPPGRPSSPPLYAPKPVSSPARRKDPVTSPVRTGKMKVGTKAPGFELVDEKSQPFKLSEALAKNPARKLLLAFFPPPVPEATGRTTMSGETSRGGEVADSDRRKLPIREGKAGGSCQSASLLSSLAANYKAIKASKTDVVAVGNESFSRHSALKGELGLPFPVLSDPSLRVSDSFVGIFDLRASNAESCGRSNVPATGQRAANLGIVIVDASGVCTRRWVVQNAQDDSIARSVDIPRLLEILRCQGDRSPPASPHQRQRPASPRPNVAVSPGRWRGEHSGADSVQCTGSIGGKRTVLVVDDSKVSARIAVKKLRALGFSTVHTMNGRLAVDYLCKSPMQCSFVLLDIVMPVMDGVETLRAIKDNDALRHIPVVMLSGLEDQGVVDMCMGSGAAAVLRKPLMIDSLQDLMGGQQKRYAAGQEQGASEPGSWH